MKSEEMKLEGIGNRLGKGGEGEKKSRGGKKVMGEERENML